MSFKDKVHKAAKNVSYLPQCSGCELPPWPFSEDAGKEEVEVSIQVETMRTTHGLLQFSGIFWRM